MNTFVQRHVEKVMGWMSGFDRLWFRGTLRLVASVSGLVSYMGYKGGGAVMRKDFSAWSQGLTEQVKQGAREAMAAAGRPVKYLGRGHVDKEALARTIAAADGIRQGPICLLETLEVSHSYELHRDKHKQALVLQPKQRLCLHQYVYGIDPEVGLSHVRMQSWLPFNVTISMNGREWLCRSLTQAGVPYLRRDNCLVWVKDMDKAKELLGKQLRTPWEQLLDRLVGQANPVLPTMLPLDGEPLERYWSLQQSEWATDILFNSARYLDRAFPMWARQAMLTGGSTDVLKFLGSHVNGDGSVPKNCRKEVVSDLKLREEGMRVKHQVGKNSVKMYNKQGSVLRTETTIHDPRGLKAYRGTEKNPQDKKWRKVRKGIADLRRVAQIAEKCNQRYLSFLSKLEADEKLGEVLAPVSRRIKIKGKTHRGLRVMERDDGQLLTAVARGEWSIKGFTNGQLRELLHPGQAKLEVREQQRQRGHMSRQLGLLRAHGIIRKIQGSRRWMLTEKGQRVVTLVAAAKHANANELLRKAA